MTLLAHISDLHLNGTPRAAVRVAQVMDQLRALPVPPDALLVTGDIADHGDPAEYREAVRLLDAPFPVLACPGNHDSRAALRTALLGTASSQEPVNHAHRVGELTVLLCDSTVPGQAGGRLDYATLAWIEEELAGTASPALLAFHHPPVPVHHPMPDGIPLANPGDLGELLGRHPEVIAIVGGHAHTAAASVFAGRPVLLAPAVTWTLVMPPEPKSLADLAAEPGFALHTVEGGHITTHFRTAAQAAVAAGR
jgi:3',5'-cyclic AMP phosphodiesterase CpdA